MTWSRVTDQLRYQHWRNRRGEGGRGAECPLTVFTGKFCWPTGKKGARKNGKKGKIRRKRRKNWKARGGKLKMEEEKVWKWAVDLFFFFFFSLFKPLKFVWALPKWTILSGKIIFQAGKNRETTLAPLKSIPLKPLCSSVKKQTVHESEYQQHNQPHSPGWVRVPLSLFFLKIPTLFLIFPQFANFHPHEKALTAPLVS